MDPHPAPTDADADPRTLRRSGRWTFRLDGDEVSEIALDGVELLESVRPALRDRNWGTVPAQVTSETWADAADAERRTLETRYDGATGAATATTILEVADDELRVRFAITAAEDLLTNRVGLTVMLPRTVAGEDAVVETVDGHRRDHRFPRQISPWQPLFGIRALDLAHGGVRAHLRLTGDEFEMEDQRNWTDASFKIYSRPLERPFPYRVAAGTSVTQEVVLRAAAPAPAADGAPAALPATADGSAAAPAPPSDAVAAPASAADAAPAPTADAAPAALSDMTALLESAPVHALPSIGLGATTAFAAVRAEAVEGLVGIDHLLVEISERYDVPRVLTAALAEARALDVPVDLRLTGGAELDVAGILAQAERAGLTVLRAAVFDEASHVTTGALHDRLVEAVAGQGIEVAAGARTHFTELNRQVGGVPAADLLTFPSTPQMHMTETWHIVRSIAALGDVLASARALRQGARLLLGPVTLRPRVNAVATEAALVDRADESGYGAHLTPGADDPRLATDWAAAWVAAVLAEASAADVEDVTLLEAAGPRGVIREDGTLTPAGEVIAALAPRHGAPVRVVREPAGPGTAILALEGLAVLANAGTDLWHLRDPQGDDLLIDPGTTRILC